MNKITILQGDWVEQLKTLADKSVHCCVTSPPYWGLRSYLPAGHPLKPLELGQEKTPEEYVAKLVAGFQEVRRVLRDDGTLWLNLGDSYTPQSTHRCNGERGGFNGLASEFKRDLAGCTAASEWVQDGAGNRMTSTVAG